MVPSPEDHNAKIFLPSQFPIFCPPFCIMSPMMSVRSMYGVLVYHQGEHTEYTVESDNGERCNSKLM